MRTSVATGSRLVSNIIKRSLSSQTTKIAATQKWVQRIVIGEKLCPFAAPLLKDDGLLRIVSSSANSTPQAVEDIKKEIL